MRTDVFDVLVRYALRLNEEQKQELYLKLQNALNLNGADKVIKELRDTKFAEGFYCPHCQSKEVVRFGQYKGRQRYRCKECLKTFSDLTNTPLKQTHYPEKWVTFIGCMIQGLSLRKSAKIVGVTWVTLFYWRHKILTSLKQINIEAFEGIFEVDETYILYSEKGKRNLGRKPRKHGGKSKYRGISKEQVCVLVARDRNKNTYSKVTCMGRINKKKVEVNIGNLVKPDNIICSDAWRSYAFFAKSKGIDHYKINSSEKEYKKGIYHIQNVNNYHHRLKQWLDRFNGVASKYLDNYLAWFKFLDTSLSFEETTANMKEMFIKSCLYCVSETYNSIRLSMFPFKTN